ncbi:MAG: hypothetical protein IJ962_05630 [Clostridia bacterium]|nr:hypothetical protein [Clostridia bacterium]
MSSGAYTVRAPRINPATISFYSGVAAAGIISVARDAKELVSDIKKINEQSRKELAELDAHSKRIEESLIKVIEETEAFRESMRKRVFTYESASSQLSSQVKIESEKATIDVTGEDLLCMEINADTNEVAYVVLDYSDVLAVENARNSAQYKKLAMASDIMKRLLVMASSERDFLKLKQALVAEINQMLDDDEVDFEEFSKTVERKLSLLEEKSRTEYKNAELWSKYCALCARAGRQPELIAENALAQAVEELFSSEVQAEYYAAARKAFFESAKELGMHIDETYELTGMPGALVADGEIPEFGLFFTDSNDSFLVEILDTQSGPETEEKKQQHANMCKRRKQLEALMEKKGYPLDIVTENDSVETALFDLQESRRKETSAETMRRRRALHGRSAKIKAAGGNS